VVVLDGPTRLADSAIWEWQRRYYETVGIDAWRSGASKWTDEQRTQFANDLARPQLLAVSLSQNRSKGDQDPSQWKPPNYAYWCTYAERWIAVKVYWKLTVTQAEKIALGDMLGTC